jgi:hypothetical protein
LLCFAFMVLAGYGAPLVTAAVPLNLRPAAAVWFSSALLAFAWYWPNLTGAA